MKDLRYKLGIVTGALGAIIGVLMIIAGANGEVWTIQPWMIGTFGVLMLITGAMEVVNSWLGRIKARIDRNAAELFAKRPDTAPPTPNLRG